AKIQIQLGQAAIKAAKAALSKKAYKEAMTQADKAVQYGFEVSSAEAIKAQAEHAIEVASQPKPPKKSEKNAPVSASSATTTGESGAPPVAQAVNPEEAQAHYRKGLAAMRDKDYHLAMQELDIASQLDATD